MKLLYLYFIISFITLSCGDRNRSSNNIQEYSGPDTTIITSIDSVIVDPEVEQQAEPQPAKIISSKIVRDKDGVFGTVVITFKNVSSKTIEAVEFSWEEVDSFGVPVGETHYSDARRGPSVANYYRETEDVIVGVNKVGKTSFQILRNEAKKLKNVKITRISFTNGDLWTAPGYIDLSRANFN